jgi:hypothetical protein
MEGGKNRGQGLGGMGWRIDYLEIKKKPPLDLKSGIKKSFLWMKADVPNLATMRLLYRRKENRMKSKLVPVLILTWVLLLNACSPFTITNTSGGQPPTPVVASETLAAKAFQPIEVDSVEVEVGLGSPIPVQVIVSGNLPDSCAQVEASEIQQDGTKFTITLSTISSTAEGCIQDTLPFRISLPLNIVNLPEGPYEVNVNGVTASFDPRAVPAEQELDAVITLERTVCFGFCPVYTLTIHGDGRVEFDGQQNVEITGKQTSRLAPAQVKELLDLFEQANYFELEDEYTAPVTDLPTTITSLTLNGMYKKIVNFGGCLDGSPVPAPSALCELETRIDEVANTAQWIGTP